MKRPGLWIPSPVWNAYSHTWAWCLDAAEGVRNGTLEDFEADVQRIVARDLADIRAVCAADQVERREMVLMMGEC